MHTRKEQMEAFGRFLDVLDELREKCPWDRKQTNESLRPNTIEETYELCDALIKNDAKVIFQFRYTANTENSNLHLEIAPFNVNAYHKGD